MTMRSATLLSALVAPALLTLTNHAGASGPSSTPCPATSTVPPVLASPVGTFLYEVIVRDEAEDPVSGALVTILFEDVSSPHLWCDGSVSVPASSPPNVSNALCALSGPDGVARFRLYGGSSAAAPTMSSYVTVMASTVPLTSPGQVGLVSTDAVSMGGSFPDGIVGTDEVIFFAVLFAAAPAISPFADFNGDGKIGLADGIMTLSDVLQGAACAGNSNVCFP